MIVHQLTQKSCLATRGTAHVQNHILYQSRESQRAYPLWALINKESDRKEDSAGSKRKAEHSKKGTGLKPSVERKKKAYKSDYEWK